MKAKLKDLLRQGEIVLKERQIEDYKNDAYCLLNKQFGVNRAQILLAGEQELEDEKVLAYWQDIRARGEHKPLQYLLGSWEFMGLPFMVNPNVLIPRAETEALAEYAIEHYPDRPIRVLDLCTGSGCIGIAVKKRLPQAEVWLVDISDLALDVARKNAEHLGAEVKIEKWDILQGVPFFMEKERFDLILSNPPYIKTEDLPTLQPEVQEEPELALNGGCDGLLYYRTIGREWTSLLKEDGVLMIEAGEDTAAPAAELLREELGNALLLKDLSGLDRYVLARKTAKE